MNLSNLGLNASTSGIQCVAGCLEERTFYAHSRTHSDSNRTINKLFALNCHSHKRSHNQWSELIFNAKYINFHNIMALRWWKIKDRLFLPVRSSTHFAKATPKKPEASHSNQMYRHYTGVCSPTMWFLCVYTSMSIEINQLLSPYCCVKCVWQYVNCVCGSRARNGRTTNNIVNGTEKTCLAAKNQLNGGCAADARGRQERGTMCMRLFLCCSPWFSIESIESPCGIDWWIWAFVVFASLECIDICAWLTGKNAERSHLSLLAVRECVYVRMANGFCRTSLWAMAKRKRNAQATTQNIIFHAKNSFLL